MGNGWVKAYRTICKMPQVYGGIRCAQSVCDAIPAETSMMANIVGFRTRELRAMTRTKVFGIHWIVRGRH
jgi:hypothetical protein